MATITLGMDLVPDIEEVLAVLRKHDAVRQQQILELIAVRHCLRARSRAAALQIAQGMHKHIRQVIEQRKGSPADETKTAQEEQPAQAGQADISRQKRAADV